VRRICKEHRFHRLESSSRNTSRGALQAPEGKVGQGTPARGKRCAVRTQSLPLSAVANEGRSVGGKKCGAHLKGRNRVGGNNSTSKIHCDGGHEFKYFPKDMGGGTM